MDLALAFMGALLGTALVGAIAKVVLEGVAAPGRARFGAFCLAAGFAMGRLGASGTVLDRAALIELSGLAGSMIACLALWRWLVRSTALPACED